MISIHRGSVSPKTEYLTVDFLLNMIKLALFTYWTWYVCLYTKSKQSRPLWKLPGDISHTGSQNKNIIIEPGKLTQKFVSSCMAKMRKNISHFDFDISFKLWFQKQGEKERMN